MDKKQTGFEPKVWCVSYKPAYDFRIFISILLTLLTVCALLAAAIWGFEALFGTSNRLNTFRNTPLISFIFLVLLGGLAISYIFLILQGKEIIFYSLEDDQGIRLQTYHKVKRIYVWAHLQRYDKSRICRYENNEALYFSQDRFIRYKDIVDKKDSIRKGTIYLYHTPYFFPVILRIPQASRQTNEEYQQYFISLSKFIDSSIKKKKR